MEVKILENSKDEIKVELDSITIAEVLRVYLNKDANVSVAVWKREHPTKNPVLLVKGKNPKKSVNDAITVASKELDKVTADFKKLK